MLSYISYKLPAKIYKTFKSNEKCFIDSLDIGGVIHCIINFTNSAPFSPVFTFSAL